MSKTNSDFFDKKTEWAVVKDELLSAYLVPYLSKILSTRKPLIYIDGFAGKGRFADGAKGSPVIACELMQDALNRTRVSNPLMKAFFIEKKHGEDLRLNLPKVPFAKVIDGDYTNSLKGLEDIGKNIFMYVDPYGVKHLNFNQFANISVKFDSAEILFNFNSFGFFRAACRAYQIECNSIDEDYWLEEQDPWTEPLLAKDSYKLTQIVGGDYWKEIVQKFKDGKIDGYEAEVEITKGLCNNLSQYYKYVLNIPVRLKSSNRPKYRMIHLSNHPDGCLLMYDNMQKRMQELFDLQYESQLILFDIDSENRVIDMSSYLSSFREHVLGHSEFVTPEKVIAEYVVDIDLSVPLADIYDVIGEMEKDGLIDVKRDPEYTLTKRKSTFLRSSSGKRIWLKSK